MTGRKGESAAGPGDKKPVDSLLGGDVGQFEPGVAETVHIEGSVTDEKGLGYDDIAEEYSLVGNAATGEGGLGFDDTAGVEAASGGVATGEGGLGFDDQNAA